MELIWLNDRYYDRLIATFILYMYGKHIEKEAANERRLSEGESIGKWEGRIHRDKRPRGELACYRSLLKY
jgi:hypothetical protein